MIAGTRTLLLGDALPEIKRISDLTLRSRVTPSLLLDSRKRERERETHLWWLLSY